ncbi:MAG: TonB-dependent receptor plug domain-containing protein [Planctomycetes bacterium]|nr:TonB-dependent receptor plug domain-containing protein [Planctomycetota bacterium]
MNKYFTMLIACLTYGSTLTAEDDLSLADLISLKATSVSFFPVAIAEAPVSVWAIDSKGIEELPVRNIDELLRYHVPGIHVSRHAFTGMLMGHRGILIDNNAKTLVMWNGQQLNQRMHFGSSLMQLQPFLGDIDRMEVVQGPGALVHGSGAIGGFINIVSKTGSSHPGTRARIGYEHTSKLWVGEVGQGWITEGGHDWYVHAGLARAEGFHSSDTYNMPTEDEKVAGLPTANLLASVRWAKGPWSFQLRGQRADIGQNAGQYQRNTTTNAPQ